jgi:hypothetical protein
VASFGAMLPNIKEIQEGSYYVVMFGAEKKKLNCQGSYMQ